MRRLVAVALLLGACDAGPGAREPRPLTTLEQLVEQYEAGIITRDEFRAGLDELEPADLPSSLVDPIEVSTLLGARDEPYRIDGPLTVGPDAILVVQEGAEIILGNDVDFTIEGRLYAVGTDATPILFRAEDGSRYGDIVLAGGPNQIVHGRFRRGSRELFVSHRFGLRTLVESCTFDEWNDLAIGQLTSSGLHVLRSSFGLDTPMGGISGETIRTRSSGLIIIEESEFGYRRGYSDVLDLQNCDRDEWPIIIHNRFDGGEDDAIDLDTCSAFVVGNRISNFSPADLSVMVQGVNGGGITGDKQSHPVIVNNVIDNCFHGIGFKNGATPIIVNNTITNSNIGVTLYQSDQTQPQPHGVLINNVLAGNTSWIGDPTPQEIILNGKWWPTYNQIDDVQATIDARFNITATLPTPYEGEGNLADDPILDVVDGIPVPGANSPALDSGLGALDFADVPMDQVLEYLSTDILGAARARSGSELPGIDRGAVEASR